MSLSGMSLPYTVCVIGLGELGTRIAGELSLFGMIVNVYDNDIKKLNDVKYEIGLQREELIRNDLSMATGVCSEVRTHISMTEALRGVDFVFEAIVDNLNIKRNLYEEITHHCKSDAVVCSNTLQLNVEEIAEDSLFQNRVIGCRFMMPVYYIPLVEVVYTSKTTPDIIDKVKSFFKMTKKRIIVRTFDENPKLLTLSETKYFWKEAKLAVEERRSKMNEKRVHSHGVPINVSKIMECEACASGRCVSQKQAKGLCVVNAEMITPVESEKENLSGDEEIIASITMSENNDEKKVLSSIEDTRHDADECSGGDDIPNECVLCNDARINCVLVPCGHMWLCFECGKSVEKSGKGCPACRNTIAQIVRVFLP